MNKYTVSQRVVGAREQKKDGEREWEVLGRGVGNYGFSQVPLIT